VHFSGWRFGFVVGVGKVVKTGLRCYYVLFEDLVKTEINSEVKKGLNSEACCCVKEKRKTWKMRWFYVPLNSNF